MKPTEELKAEHKGILRMLRILDAVCERLERGQEVNPKYLDDIVEFIRVFADKCHHGKEEDLLFPAMEREAGLSRYVGPLAVMLAEHTEGRGYVAKMAAALEEYRQGDANAGLIFAANGRRYVSLLTEHINKEDNILYPIADERVSAEQQHQLSEGFERVEREEVGAGRHDAFHDLLDELTEVYVMD